MTGEEAVARYPGLRLPHDFLCVLEKDGGILLADKALAAAQVCSSPTAIKKMFVCIRNLHWRFS